MADAGVRSRRGVREGGAAAEGGADEIRARVAAARRPTLLKKIVKCYDSANDVVNVPFIACVCLAIAAFFYANRRPSGRERILAASNGTEGWMWGYGEGKDVAGKVNCTTYVHMSLGTVVEMGHGSGGGITFRASHEGQAIWVWEDGGVELQDSGLACKSLAAQVYRQGGQRGVPTYRLFNRYNREFWIPDRAGGSSGEIVYRNALNPVTVTFHARGFTFLTKEAKSNVTVEEGRVYYEGHAANATLLRDGNAANASAGDFSQFVKHGPPAPPPPPPRRKGVVVEKVNGRPVTVLGTAGEDDAVET